MRQILNSHFQVRTYNKEVRPGWFIFVQVSTMVATCIWQRNISCHLYVALIREQPSVVNCGQGWAGESPPEVPRLPSGNAYFVQVVAYRIPPSQTLESISGHPSESHKGYYYPSTSFLIPSSMSLGIPQWVEGGCSAKIYFQVQFLLTPWQ